MSERGENTEPDVIPHEAGFGGITALLSLIGLAGAQRGRELNPE